jgi:hypothetical protein
VTPDPVTAVLADADTIARRHGLHPDWNPPTPFPNQDWTHLRIGHPDGTGRPGWIAARDKDGRLHVRISYRGWRWVQYVNNPWHATLDWPIRCVAALIALDRP